MMTPVRLPARLIARLAERLQARGRTRAAWLAASCFAALTRRDTEALYLLGRLATENRDAARIRAVCEEILAASPDDTEALEVLGKLCMDAGQLDAALAHFARRDAIVSEGTALTRLYRHQDLDAGRMKRQVPHYVRLEHVLVDTAYWSIMTDGGVFHSADTHGRSPFNNPFLRGRVSSDGGLVVASYPAPSVAIERECIFVGGDQNYSHWVFRNLQKLACLEDDGLLDRLPWLLNRDLSAYQLEYLEMLGVGPDRRVLVERGAVIRCERLVVPALVTWPQVIAMGVKWIRRRLSPYMVAPGAASGLIYVSRRDASVRHVANEDELYDRLRPLGFELIVAGQLSAREQIRAFSGARLIVAVHGAALANMLFAPDHAAIVEINSSAKASMDDYRKIARAMGQRMATVISHTYADPREPVHADSSYRVDVEAVLEQVARFMAS
jgi:capsular polysaccharide biosynthesis protein